jgi:hypothetical protein
MVNRACEFTNSSPLFTLIQSLEFQYDRAPGEVCSLAKEVEYEDDEIIECNGGSGAVLAGCFERKEDLDINKEAVNREAI